jgi:hypothetical protein
MSDETLHTLNRHWATGEFITVRRGTKYEDKEGTIFNLCECWGDDHGVVGQAVATGTKVYELGEIPARILETHYNAHCRIYSGLMKALQTAYGEDAVDDWTEVTVLSLSTLAPPNEGSEG